MPTEEPQQPVVPTPGQPKGAGAALVRPFMEYLGLSGIFDQLCAEAVHVKKAPFCIMVTFVMLVWVLYGKHTVNSENEELRGDIKSLTFNTQSNVSLILALQRDAAALRSRVTDFEFERDPSAVAVRKRAAILSNQISDFVQTWKKNDPMPANRWAEFTNMKQEDREKRVFEQDQQEAQYMEKMIAEFAKRFLGRAKTIREQLKELGLQSQELDLAIKYPRMPMYIQSVPQELQKLADQIKD